MARQEGIIRLSGTLRDLVFYTSKNKDLVRQKGKPYELSENSKKAGKDFGEATKNAAYIRKAFDKGVKSFGDDELINRLNKLMIEVFKTIPKTQQGNKNLIEGNLNLLNGFQFNRHSDLTKLLLKLPLCTINETGLLNIKFAAQPLLNMIKRVYKASTAQLQLMVFNFDLDGDAYEIFEINPLLLHFGTPDFIGARLNIPTEQKGEKALIVALGVSYLKDKYCSKDRRYYACQIINALHLKDGQPVEFVAEIPPEIKMEEDNEGDGLDWEMGEE